MLNQEWENVKLKIRQYISFPTQLQPKALPQQQQQLPTNSHKQHYKLDLV